jgi:cysteinyl-tRNA synthetase
MPTARDRLASWVSSANATESLTLLNEVREHLDNDLDTPAALKAIDQAVAQGFSAKNAAALLGIDI